MVSRGFTLLEMLVVLTIMGIFAGLVTANARLDNTANLRVESERLAQLLDLAATRARLTGRPIVWTTDGRSYDFWYFSKDDGWSRIVDESLLHSRVLPSGMTLSQLKVENVPAIDAMRVEFASHGSTPAFSVIMSLGANRYTVVNSPIGELRTLPQGDLNAAAS